MNSSRTRLLALAVFAALILVAMPQSASAVPTDRPKPTISGIPALTNQTGLDIVLTTTAPSDWFVDFRCSFDLAAFTDCRPFLEPTCTAPMNETKTCTDSIPHRFDTGKHLFRAQAMYCDEDVRDTCDWNGGWYGSSFQSVSFSVDIAKPVISITSGPSKTSQVTKPGGGAFVFSSPESLAFTCSIDDEPETSCTSPFTVPKSLKNGTHEFFVFATDAAGNVGGAVKKFKVDVFHPKKCKKGMSKSAKAKYKKCKAKNKAAKKVWKKKHNLK